VRPPPTGGEEETAEVSFLTFCPSKLNSYFHFAVALVVNTCDSKSAATIISSGSIRKYSEVLPTTIEMLYLQKCIDYFRGVP
jgi:hypothetical protein